jgi:hypothetical protein
MTLISASVYKKYIYFTCKSISTGVQYVTPDSKFVVKKSRCASLAQEIGFSAPNLCSLQWLVKGATQLCSAKKECNKLDLTGSAVFLIGR